MTQSDILFGVPVAKILSMAALQVRPVYNTSSQIMASFPLIWTGKRLPICTLDITFYRDDLSKKREIPEVKGSLFPVDINGKEVIICDDVLYTGRTCRAAIDSIFAKGRPKRISLCVLIDRGHRELPIRPDYVGKNVPTSQKEVVKVNIESIDGKTDVEIIRKEGDL